jgi:hypothetical protein
MGIEMGLWRAEGDKLTRITPTAHRLGDAAGVLHRVRSINAG